MYYISKLMALFWTFAEGLILIYMRWGFIFLTQGKGGQKIFAVFSAAVFILLIWLMFGAEPFVNRFVDLNRDSNKLIYRWALWNFFCTLWVTLEGVIMVYVFRLYRVFRFPLREKAPESRNRGVSTTGLKIGVPLLVFFLFTLYFLYEYGLILAVNNYDLNAGNIHHISLFYIKVCGVFWIIFEWIVAILGIKAYLLLKSNNDRL